MNAILLLLSMSTIITTCAQISESEILQTVVRACASINWKKLNNDLTTVDTCACNKPKPKDVVADACACSKPRPKNVVADACACSKPRPKNVVADACACSKPRPKNVVADACACSKPKPKDVVADGCACSKPRPKNVVADACACSKPKPKDIIADACACSKPRPKDVVADACACSKPKPKDVVADGCACGKPRPKKDAIRHEVLMTHLCSTLLKKRFPQPTQYVYISPQDIPQGEKTLNGGELFAACATNAVEMINAGIKMNNTGKIEAGLPQFFNGLNGVVQIIAQTRNPEKTLEEFNIFMENFDSEDYQRMLRILEYQSE